MEECRIAARGTHCSNTGLTMEAISMMCAMIGVAVIVYKIESMLNR